jgi:hypothetical protein
MSTTQLVQVMEPELLDIVDDAWLQDKLPDDSGFTVSLPPIC